jgi:hypothetical protein
MERTPSEFLNSVVDGFYLTVIPWASDMVISFECGWKNCKRPRPFKNKGTLMRHIKTQHVDMREIECPVLRCGRVFNRKDKMDDHVYRVHRSQL